MKRTFIITILICFTSVLLAQTRIKMQKEGGVYTIPCLVNGLKLRFIFDTGASNVCISLTEATFMFKNGYLNANDIVGDGKSQIADGSLVENIHIILRQMEIGGIKFDNIDAVVMNNIKAPLLLGQSAIQKLGAVQILGDEMIILNGKANIPYIKKSTREKWFEVYNDKKQKMEIDLNSIEREDDYINCYGKTTYIDENKRKEEANYFSDSRCKNVSYDEGIKIHQLWENYLYYTYKTSFNCKNNMFKALAFTYYDKNGSVIDSHRVDDEWQYIPPESIVSDNLNALRNQCQIFHKGQIYLMYIEDKIPFLEQYPEAKLVE